MCPVSEAGREVQLRLEASPDSWLGLRARDAFHAGNIYAEHLPLVEVAFGQRNSQLSRVATTAYCDSDDQMAKEKPPR